MEKTFDSGKEAFEAVKDKAEDIGQEVKKSTQ
jgi:hypothetical protein